MLDDTARAVVRRVDLEDLVAGLPGEDMREGRLAEAGRARQEQDLRARSVSGQLLDSWEPEELYLLLRSAVWVGRLCERQRQQSGRGSRTSGSQSASRRTTSSNPSPPGAPPAPLPNPPFPPSLARLLRLSRLSSAAALALLVPLKTHMSHSLSQIRAVR